MDNSIAVFVLLIRLREYYIVPCARFLTAGRSGMTNYITDSEKEVLQQSGFTGWAPLILGVQ